MQENDGGDARRRGDAAGKPKRDGERPVLPDVTRDEEDAGWGDEPRTRDADWYRRQRPPHHE